LSGPLSNPFMFSSAASKGAVDLLEADADSDTFVCEFTGDGDETGAGGGLSGSDLVLTEAGTVSNASDGWRTLNDGAFRPTSAWIDHFFNGHDGDERTLAMHVRNVDITPSGEGEANGLFNWVGSPAHDAWYLYIPSGGGNADKLSLINMTGNAGVGIDNTQFSGSNLFSATDDVWICWWQDGTYDRFGWVEDDAPSKWSDFPSAQRATASFDGAYGVNTAANYGFGIQNASVSGRFEINRVVMSLSGTIIEND